VGSGHQSAGVVVVTGVSRYLGAHVAGRLRADPRVGHVIGLDAAPPPADLAPVLDGVELVHVDLTRLTTVIDHLAAQTVVHLGVVTAPDPSAGGRAAM
jgi:UDP-glucose 4-epimerase